MKKNHQENLEQYKEKLLQSAADKGLLLVAEKPLNYGIQIVLGNSTESVSVNIYCSEKRGLSTVIGGNEENPLRKVIEEIVSGPGVNSPEPSIHSWQSWLGTDEAGKGDFFGALVVAGFYAEMEILPELQKIGVRDSKKISKTMIQSIAHKLYKSFPERICVVSLNPLVYNKLYRDFVNQHKKLNELMAWMHGRVILNLMEKSGENKVLVDKFTTDKKLLQTLKDLDKIELLQVPKAERDLAVAAASIIARYHYLDSLKLLKKKYGLDFNAGSGSQSLDTGVAFARKYSLERLQEVAKIHFKNYTNIQEILDLKQD